MFTFSQAEFGSEKYVRELKEAEGDFSIENLTLRFYVVVTADNCSRISIEKKKRQVSNMWNVNYFGFLNKITVTEQAILLAVDCGICMYINLDKTKFNPT